MRTSELLYRLALSTWPKGFREDFGEASTRDFLRLVEERRRVGGRLALIGRAVVDAIATGVRERKRALRRASPWHPLSDQVRDAYRSLKSKPGFMLLIVLMLALGMGVNSAIFNVLYEVTLAPLPFPEPERLVVLKETDLEAAGDGTNVTPANFYDWRELSSSFDALAAVVQTSMNLTGNGAPERLVTCRVSSSLFPVLRVEPSLGRTFATEEDAAGSGHVVVLGHGFWQRRFGADANVLGKDVILDGVAHRVIGVLPPWFRFPSRETDVFVPLAMDTDERSSRRSHYLDVFGRLRANVTLSQASEEMNAIAASLAEEYPDTNADNGAVIRSLDEELRGDSATPLVVLLLAVSAVLFIAVVNVANLLVARGTARQKEIAVRAALGASRSRILVQLFTESALLAFAGGSLGLMFGVWAEAFFQVLTPQHIALEPSWWQPSSLVFSLVLSAAVATGMGLLPAWQLSRLGSGPLTGSTGLRGGTTSPSATRSRSMLVISEVALALVLLILGGLMIRSFVTLIQRNPGFRTENVLTMRIDLSGSRYLEHHQKVAFYRELQSRVERLPGARSSGFITMLPLTLQGGSILFEISDHPDEAIEPNAVFRSVTPGFFRTLGIPLMEGRLFDHRDGPAAPKVAIVDETLASRYFPSESPLGRRLEFWGANVEIIGVVGSVQHLTLNDDERPTIYVAAAQRSYGFFDPRDLAVSTRVDPISLVADVRAEVWAMDAEQPIASIRPIGDIVSEAVANERLQTILLSAFGAAGLFLATLGIYGVLSYVVSQRTDEIGLRMALGARRSDVVRMVAGQGLKWTLLGIGIGLLVTVTLNRTVTGTLYDATPSDSWTIVAIATLLGTVAFAACVLPALRASRIDPLRALRSE